MFAKIVRAVFQPSATQLASQVYGAVNCSHVSAEMIISVLALEDPRAQFAPRRQHLLRNFSLSTHSPDCCWAVCARLVQVRCAALEAVDCGRWALDLSISRQSDTARTSLANQLWQTDAGGLCTFSPAPGHYAICTFLESVQKPVCLSACIHGSCIAAHCGKGSRNAAIKVAKVLLLSRNL
jgi:hypothetical protein